MDNFDRHVKLKRRSSVEKDLRQALEAIDYVMSLDKPNSNDLIDWRNDILDLLQEYGYQRYTLKMV